MAVSYAIPNSCDAGMSNRSNMLRTITTVIALIILLLAYTAYAFAAFDLDRFYAADKFDENQKTEFGWDETPYIYYKFTFVDVSETDTLNIGATWGSPTSDFYGTGDLITVFSGNNLELWHCLDNWNSGSPARELGQWNVTTGWFLFDQSASGLDSTSFTVTPEPVSSLLFLIGGAGLVTRRYYKRKHS